MPDLLGDLPVPLSDQIAEVERELRQRDRVYPRLIGKGQLTQQRAEQQVRALRAALDSLFQLRDMRAGVINRDLTD